MNEKESLTTIFRSRYRAFFSRPFANIVLTYILAFVFLFMAQMCWWNSLPIFISLYNGRVSPNHQIFDLFIIIWDSIVVVAIGDFLSSRIKVKTFVISGFFAIFIIIFLGSFEIGELFLGLSLNFRISSNYAFLWLFLIPGIYLSKHLRKPKIRFVFRVTAIFLYAVALLMCMHLGQYAVLYFGILITIRLIMLIFHRDCKPTLIDQHGDCKPA